MDNFQEALEDIEEPEYKEDGYRADQCPQHTSPQDVEDGGDADESKEDLLQEEVVTTQKVSKHLPSQKGKDGVPPAPTKSGTPPNRTKDVAGYTTPHSSFESIPEEKSKESPKKWNVRVQPPAGKEAARKWKELLRSQTKKKEELDRKRTAFYNAVWEG